MAEKGNCKDKESGVISKAIVSREAVKTSDSAGSKHEDRTSYHKPVISSL